MNVGKKDVGYLVLMRTSTDKDEVPDKMRYTYYRDHLLIPFVKQSRLEYDGYSEEEGGTILSDLCAVSWCDNDLLKISSIVSNLSIFFQNKIIANK